MNRSKIYLTVASVINATTAIVHAIAGQIDLVNPMMDSTMLPQQKVEWLGLWHMITLFFVLTSIVMIRIAFSNLHLRDYATLLRFLSIAYILFALAFIGASFWSGLLAPQWFLLLPIGILLWLSARSDEVH